MTAQPDVIVLFDLDHTLLPHDSDATWVEFLIEEGALDRAVFEHANRDLRDRYQRGEAGALEFTEFYLSTLKPFTREQLEVRHQAYMQRKVLPVIPKGARDLIARHHKAGHLTVLTTATSRFLTAPIAEELGFEHLIATEPELVDDRFTGRVVGIPNMREGKVERLVAWLADRGMKLADFRQSWFYSDSQNDLPLLSHVTHPVAVNADPVLAAHARHKGWPVLRIE